MVRALFMVSHRPNATKKRPCRALLFKLNSTNAAGPKEQHTQDQGNAPDQPCCAGYALP